MSTTLQNSIWPNEDGNLGNIKVQIPTGDANDPWPTGDALLGNCVYQNGKLVGFVDTKALIENDSKTTILPYDFVDITVDKRLETLMTFNAGERCKRLNVKYDIFLPKGYKRLEYLESTGERQWIDTGIKADAGISAACIYYQSPEVLESATWHQYIFGCGRDTSNFAFLGIHNDVPSTLYYFKSTLGVRAERPAGKIACLCDATGMELNGTRYEFSSTAELTESFYTCKLFAREDGVGSLWAFAKAQVYSFSISRAGEMQLNFIPCLDPNGAPCMYDIISQEPFYNEGTGQFLYPGAESQVVTSGLDEIFYAKKTAHGIQKLYHVPENFSGSKDEYAIENGFKQLVEPPMPTEGYWVPEWTETDTQLICNWVEDSVLP